MARKYSIRFRNRPPDPPTLAQSPKTGPWADPSGAAPPWWCFPTPHPRAPPAPALALPTAPKPAPTADVAAAILAAAVPADDTPARAYLAARGTWPPLGTGPDLRAAVRWLPPDAWARLPTWPGRDGRPRRLTPPADGIRRSLRPDAPPVPRCGAVVFELARPGCAPDAVELEAVTADGRRPAERWRKAPGGASGRTFTCPALIGDPWPLAVAVVEGGADALALARLRLPGVLVRSAAGTSGLRSIGAAVVADLPATVAVRCAAIRWWRRRAGSGVEAARRPARRRPGPCLLLGDAGRRRP